MGPAEGVKCGDVLQSVEEELLGFWSSCCWFNHAPPNPWCGGAGSADIHLCTVRVIKVVSVSSTATKKVVLLFFTQNVISEHQYSKMQILQPWIHVRSVLVALGLFLSVSSTALFPAPECE